jgi:adenosylhomocysteine nucleosidase
MRPFFRVGSQTVTDPWRADPCVLFALGREALFFRRARPRPRPFRGAPCRAEFRGGAASVLAVEAGLGRAAVEVALSWLLAEPSCGGVRYRPAFVLSAGFSGGLTPGLRVGDLVLANEVADTEGGCWPTTWPASAPASWKRGRVLTAPAPVADPKDKVRLGLEHGAVAVDMETAAVARLCQRHGVPFGCLRVISDDHARPLSRDLTHLLRHGRVAPLRLLGAVAGNPLLVRELWRLAGHTRRAARELGRGLDVLLGLGAGP